MKTFFYVLFLIVPIFGFSQKDSSFIAQSPVFVRVSPIFLANHIGSQIGVMKLQNQKEIYRKRHSKPIKNERFIGLDLSFYSQRYLHNSLSLLPNYTFRRVNPYGFYRQINTFLGISQTFLNEESYQVNDKNEVIQNKIAGNFYLTGGFNLEIGKMFQKKSFLNEIHASLLIQTYYPNFRFIALRPSLSIGTSFKLPKIQKNFNKRVIKK